MEKLVYLVAIASLFSIAFGQITFTGNAQNDFDPSKLNTVAKNSWLKVNESLTITPSTFMVGHGWRTGMDILNVFFQYDYLTDNLYVGVDCDGICGDVDGDGNPSKSSDPSALDQPNMCFTEQLSLMVWPEPPVDWEPRNEDFTWFFPEFIVGVSATACLPSGFGAFEFNGHSACTWDDANAIPETDACVSQQNKVTDPSNGGYGADLPTLTRNNALPVPAPKLFANPNSTFPDIEFILPKFSRYPGFTFKDDGTDPISFGFSLYSASTSDSVGEDRVFPSLYSIPCPLKDACGVCGGDNSTCWDCLRVPFGSARYDACGVCAGDNTTCLDCARIPNGRTHYDACGVCGGNNSTCSDCFGVPNGNATYDRFGLCGGSGESGCDGIPYSTTVYDFCGICGGDNTTCMCLNYLGYDLFEVDYALLRYTVLSSLIKINDTLDVLYTIKEALECYDYENGELSLAGYIDVLHSFCDECLDHFDFTQMWFADYIAGNCDDTDCEPLTFGNYHRTWVPLQIDF